MQSLLKILSQMTGLQKLSVIRNLIVLPLLLLSFTLDGGLFAFTAPIVLPWVLYMGFNLGSNSHRLQATNGFQLTPKPPRYLRMSMTVLYVLSFVVGIVYVGVIGALIPGGNKTAAPQALHIALIGSVFFGVFLTVVGVRMGWSSVEASVQGTDAATTSRLVNPAGVKRQQLIYLAAGVFVLICSLASLSHTYPRWAGEGSDASTSPTQDGATLASLLPDDSATSTDQQKVPPPEPTQAPQPADATVAMAVQTAAPAASGLPSLCIKDEYTVWTGTKGQKIFSLCASTNLSRTTGYMQYRADIVGDTQFKYPATLDNPHGIFSYSEGAHSAEIDFSSGGFSYSISEQADGSETDINVTLPSGNSSTIVLDKASNTLGQNSTSDLFQKLGLSQ